MVPTLGGGPPPAGPCGAGGRPGCQRRSAAGGCGAARRSSWQPAPQRPEPPGSLTAGLHGATQRGCERWQRSARPNAVSSRVCVEDCQAASLGRAQAASPQALSTLAGSCHKACHKFAKAGLRTGLEPQQLQVTCPPLTWAASSRPQQVEKAFSRDALACLGAHAAGLHEGLKKQRLEFCPGGRRGGRRPQPLTCGGMNMVLSRPSRWLPGCLSRRLQDAQHGIWPSMCCQDAETMMSFWSQCSVLPSSQTNILSSWSLTADTTTAVWMSSCPC